MKRGVCGPFSFSSIDTLFLSLFPYIFLTSQSKKNYLIHLSTVRFRPYPVDPDPHIFLSFPDFI